MQLDIRVPLVMATGASYYCRCYNRTSKTNWMHKHHSRYYSYNSDDGSISDGLLVGELGLVVLNEPASHTRIRLGACRDTSPNLAIWLDEGAIAWSNSFEDLGSHHRVLCLTVVEAESEVDGCQKAKIVDWDELRENREREKQASPIEDIGEWCRGLLADVDRVTKEIYLTDCRQEVSRKSGDRPHGSIDDGALELSRVDSPLAYDVEAKKSMQRRASEEKLYRKIRKKIADINLEIKETHCA
ncbi:hypothetical protein HPB51_019457 [Rhipicephalus microplus]|uniref:Tick transposon n=1 Tax=Rhipicephalus microplus TaxID=6941 RepID=A0A9J6DVQ9_RHIMP|nr:hypothetical protein HPB51_019457 [Rhipicephalus microplus]